MSSKDFLTRYFQQLGEVIARLIGLREKGNHELILSEIDQVFATWFNLSSEQIENKSSQDLLELIDNTDDKKNEKLESIAELLYQKAVTLRQIENKTYAVSVAAKALELFKTVDEQSITYSIKLQERIAELDQMIKKA